MGGQQSSMTNEEIFSNHSKINFVPSEPHDQAKTKTIGKLSGDECKLVESLCIGSLASGKSPQWFYQPMRAEGL